MRRTPDGKNHFQSETGNHNASQPPFREAKKKMRGIHLPRIFFFD
jgi:hypothetical protein